MTARFLLLLTGVLSATLAWAGALRDPTLPPSTFAAAATDGAPVAEQPLVLEGIKRPRSGAATALINGEVLQIGAMIRGLRLVAIRETEVVLEGEQGRELLRLAPAVEKRMPIQVNRRPQERAVRGSGS